MKIIIAGATGAIGRPLINLLVAEGHEVYGITQSKERAQALAEREAKPLLLNVLDRDAVFSSINSLQPEIVIDMLTHLPKEYTPQSMNETAEMNAKLRIEGGKHLLDAAERSGTRRYIAQSCAFWYAPGSGLADESTPLAFEATPGITAGVKTYAEIERRTLDSKTLEGIALRFGFFYGPGTWFYPGESVANQVHKQLFPIIGDGQGVWNFVHIEDAAQAIKDAINSSRGVYNIVNDIPSEMKKWLPSFANFLRAPPPPTISEEEAQDTKGADTVYYATKLRGASNAKAKRELQFVPRPFEWFSFKLS